MYCSAAAMLSTKWAWRTELMAVEKRRCNARVYETSLQPSAHRLEAEELPSTRRSRRSRYAAIPVYPLFAGWSWVRRPTSRLTALTRGVLIDRLAHTRSNLPWRQDHASTRTPLSPAFELRAAHGCGRLRPRRRQRQGAGRVFRFRGDGRGDHADRGELPECARNTQWQPPRLSGKRP